MAERMEDMKIDLTEKEMMLTYNKLNTYLNQREHLKGMGGCVKDDDNDVLEIMQKLQAGIIKCVKERAKGK